MKTLKIELRPYESATQAINRTLKEIKESVHVQLEGQEGQNMKKYTLDVEYVVQGELQTQQYVFDEVRLEMLDEAKWKIIQKALKEIEDRERGPF